MKVYVLFILLFTSFFCSFAQQAAKDTLPELEFSREQREIWDSLERNWAQKHFNPFLKKNKITISCAKCERVVFGVYFEIHEDGHCHPKLLWSKRCGADFTKQQKDGLKKILMLFEFPPPFYNTNIKVLMGRALKC